MRLRRVLIGSFRIIVGDIIMINSLNHARRPEDAVTYKVESYAIAADIYALAPHIGRGGWSWYTGSAGWMYRLTVDSPLGLTLHVERLRSRHRCQRNGIGSRCVIGFGKRTTPSPSGEWKWPMTAR